MKNCPNCGFWLDFRLNNKRQRSNAENKYLHGVVLPILAHHTGYTQDDIKGVLKWQFKVKSTSKLSTVEFEKLMSDIRSWASLELGLYIPEPNEGGLNVM